MQITKLDGVLTSLAALVVEADFQKTDVLPALEMPKAKPDPKPKKSEFPELRAGSDVTDLPAAMNAMIGVNRTLELVMRSANDFSKILKAKKPLLSTVKKSHEEMKSRVVELTKYVDALGKALS